MVTTGAGAADNGGAKVGSLRLGFSPLGLGGQLEVPTLHSHAPELLTCLPPMDLEDKVRLL